MIFNIYFSTGEVIYMNNCRDPNLSNRNFLE